MGRLPHRPGITGAGWANSLLICSQDCGEAESRREKESVEPVYWADIRGEALVGALL